MLRKNQFTVELGIYFRAKTITFMFAGNGRKHLFKLLSYNCTRSYFEKPFKCFFLPFLKKSTFAPPCMCQLGLRPRGVCLQSPQPPARRLCRAGPAVQGRGEWGPGVLLKPLNQPIWRPWPGRGGIGQAPLTEAVKK
jgi:hypothetical protein